MAARYGAVLGGMIRFDPTEIQRHVFTLQINHTPPSRKFFGHHFLQSLREIGKKNLSMKCMLMSDAHDFSTSSRSKLKRKREKNMRWDTIDNRNFQTMV